MKTKKVSEAWVDVPCVEEDCTRMVPEGDERCFVHSGAAQAQLHKNAAAEHIRDAEAYRERYQKLKTIDGLMDLVAEIIYRVTNVGDPLSDEEAGMVGKSNVIFDAALIKAIFAGIALQRQFVKDRELDQKLRVLEALYRENMGITAGEVLANMDRLKNLRLSDTAQLLSFEGKPIDV